MVSAASDDHLRREALALPPARPNMQAGRLRFTPL
jgi:hypothetical protein